MTIDEAIEHAEEVEKENRKLSKRYDDASGYSRSGNKDIRTNDAKKCEKCAEEHRQIAEWLKDYKRLLEQEPKADSEIIRDESVKKILDELEKEFVKIDIPIMDKLTLFAKITNAIYKFAEQDLNKILTKSEG